jgi:peroxiredoxin
MWYKTQFRQAIFWWLLLCSLDTFSNTPIVGSVAPEFQAKTLSGESVVLSQVLHQGPVLLVFWATWCPHCRSEVPALKALHAHFSPRLTVLGVNIAINDSIPAVRRYQQAHQLTYPLVFDQDRQLRKRYRVVGTPTQILINQQGRIHYRGSETPAIKTMEDWWTSLSVSTEMTKTPLN